MIYIGIDPGYNGFITVINENREILDKYPMPVKKKLREVDGETLANFLAKWCAGDKQYCLYVEDVHAIFGSAAGSTFTFGKNVGMLLGALEAEAFSYKLVAPKLWQKHVWISKDIVRVPSSSGKTMVTDTKATSLNAAKRLFPGGDFRKSTRATQPHDGMVDSLLIATYAWSKN